MRIILDHIRRLTMVIPWVAFLVWLLVHHLGVVGTLRLASDDSYIYLGYVKSALTWPPSLFSYNPGEYSLGTAGVGYYYFLIVVCALVRIFSGLFLSFPQTLILGSYTLMAILWIACGVLYLSCWKKMLRGPQRTLDGQQGYSNPGPAEALLAFAIFCANPRFLWGMFSGLENPLMAFLALAILNAVLYNQSVGYLGVLAALTSVTRPEMGPLAVGIAGAAAVCKGWTRLAEIAPTFPLRLFQALFSLSICLCAMAAATALLMLPFYMVTGSAFPGVGGSLTPLGALSKPSIFLANLKGATFWQNEWLLVLYLISIVAMCVAPHTRRWASVGVCTALGLFFAWRAGLSLNDFQIRDRDVSYTWPLFALIIGSCVQPLWASLCSGNLFGVGPIRLIAVSILIIVGLRYPVSQFIQWLDKDVRQTNSLCVNPAIYMRDHLPAKARVNLGSAGAVRLFTNLYIIDREGTTTTHRKLFPGDYHSFIAETKAEYVVDSPDRVPELSDASLFQSLQTWEAEESAAGKVTLYKVIRDATPAAPTLNPTSEQTPQSEKNSESPTVVPVTVIEENNGGAAGQSRQQ